MTRIPFDQLSKQFLEELLSPVGIVQRSLEVPGESKFVDVWFTPNAAAEAAPNLGLLSRIASTACLLEPLLQDCGATLRTDWLAGVYFVPEVMKAAIISINELPSTPETLGLRVLGRQRAATLCDRALGRQNM